MIKIRGWGSAERETLPQNPNVSGVLHSEGEPKSHFRVTPQQPENNSQGPSGVPAVEATALTRTALGYYNALFLL